MEDTGLGGESDAATSRGTRAASPVPESHGTIPPGLSGETPAHVLIRAGRGGFRASPPRPPDPRDGQRLWFEAPGLWLFVTAVREVGSSLLLLQAAPGRTGLPVGRFARASPCISHSKANPTSGGQTRSRFEWKWSFYPFPLSSRQLGFSSISSRTPCPGAARRSSENVALENDARFLLRDPRVPLP